MFHESKLHIKPILVKFCRLKQDLKRVIVVFFRLLINAEIYFVRIWKLKSQNVFEVEETEYGLVENEKEASDISVLVKLAANFLVKEIFENCVGKVKFKRKLIVLIV